MSHPAEHSRPDWDFSIWILGCMVSCAEIRASFKGRLPEDHACTPGGIECSFENVAHDRLMTHSGMCSSPICIDLRLLGPRRHRVVVELERSTNRAELEAKLPMEMPEELRKVMAKYVEEPAVFPWFADKRTCLGRGD